MEWKLQKALLLPCLAVFAFGCESKFSESSPDKVAVSGHSLEERIEQKKRVDVKIDEVQKGADKIKKLLDLFKKIQNPTMLANVYTPIDFFIDLNNELREKIPDNGGDRLSLTRYGKMTLPLKNLSEECRTVETGLVQETIDGAEEAGGRLVYSLKTCRNEKFEDVFAVEWAQSKMNFVIIGKNLQNIFADLAQQALQQSSCQITQGDKGILDTISCTNLELRLSVSELAVIKALNFDSTGDVRLEGFADIFENNILKAKSELRILANGERKFEIKKVEEAKQN